MNKLLLTLVILISTNTLHNMAKEPQPFPMTLSQLYYHFSHDVLDPDIAQQIFLLQLKSSNVDLKKLPEFCKNSLLVVSYIMRLIGSCGYSTASEICERFFAGAKISICAIKDDSFKKSCLHYAIDCIQPEVAQILIKIAGEDKDKLLTMQDSPKGNTALHYTSFMQNRRLAELILDAAGDKAPTLIMMKNKPGNMAFNLTEKVIQKYMTNNKTT